MKRWLSIGISFCILILIYGKIDLDGFLDVLKNSDRLWMPLSLGMVIPLTLLTAWRLQLLMPGGTGLDFAEANRLILASSVLNMVLPSKMGDLAKAYFMRDKGQLNGSLALSLVVFEKACDLLSLLLWCVLGLILYPEKNWLYGILTLCVTIGLGMGLLLLGSKSLAQVGFQFAITIVPKSFTALKLKIQNFQTGWEEMHDYFWADKIQLFRITSLSIVIWFFHLFQIWLFILALNAWTPFLTNLALSPLAILAGLLPLTFAGVGTRDAAIILFYQPYFNAPTGAALGLLCTSRYLLPALGGLPFLGQYLTMMKNADRLPPP